MTDYENIGAINSRDTRCLRPRHRHFSRSGELRILRGTRTLREHARIVVVIVGSYRYSRWHRSVLTSRFRCTIATARATSAFRRGARGEGRGEARWKSSDAEAARSFGPVNKVVSRNSRRSLKRVFGRAIVTRRSAYPRLARRIEIQEAAAPAAARAAGFARAPDRSRRSSRLSGGAGACVAHSRGKIIARGECCECIRLTIL